MTDLRDQMAMAALTEAMAEYDARLAECPINSANPEVRRASLVVCRVCKATQSESCGRDNPWRVVQAARAMLAERNRTTKGEDHV
ncbi:MAG: hypothetical protein ACK5QX_04540 [bacterium]|jgi:hypothetical protein